MQPTFLNGKLTTIWICIKQRTPTGPLFMSLKIRERIRTPTGPLFMSLKIRERVMALGPFFHELRNLRACNGPVE